MRATGRLDKRVQLVGRDREGREWARCLFRPLRLPRERYRVVWVVELGVGNYGMDFGDILQFDTLPIGTSIGIVAGAGVLWHRELADEKGGP